MEKAAGLQSDPAPRGRRPCSTSVQIQIKKEENAMQRKKLWATLGLLRRDVSGYGGQGVVRHKVLGYGLGGVAVTIVVAALTLASKAASSQARGESDSATAGETTALRLPGGAASSQRDGSEPDAATGYNILHLFTWAKNPQGNLIFDAAGNLYGTTSGGSSCTSSTFGCGVVWKLARNSKGAWTVSILHAFTGPDGARPFAGVIFDAAGNLYGTTLFGGASGYGVVFKLAPNPDGTWTESVLYSFTVGTDGFVPWARLVFDAVGNLYGTTSAADPGFGVVFKLAPNPDGTWTESVLYSFTGGADGNEPEAGLIFDAAGNLYGTTYVGGSSTACDFGCGVVFKLAPNPDGTWTESVLYSFTGGADGAFPEAGLVFDAAGNLYGTTANGGAPGSATWCEPGGCGTVFKLAPDADGTWSESVLHRFSGGADGSSPEAGVTFDAAGNLYGTTWNGGDDTACPTGCGVVFKLAPSSSGWSETVLHTFSGIGGYPVAPVIFDPAGNLYGTASDGNHHFDYGLVFEITRVAAVDGKKP
jgi:uncharacterized repeat protein (TIGR03803 family)